MLYWTLWFFSLHTHWYTAWQLGHVLSYLLQICHHFEAKSQSFCLHLCLKVGNRQLLWVQSSRSTQSPWSPCCIVPLSWPHYLWLWWHFWTVRNTTSPHASKRQILRSIRGLRLLSTRPGSSMPNRSIQSLRGHQDINRKWYVFSSINCRGGYRNHAHLCVGKGFFLNQCCTSSPYLLIWEDQHLLSRYLWRRP